MTGSENVIKPLLIQFTFVAEEAASLERDCQRVRESSSGHRESHLVLLFNNFFCLFLLLPGGTLVSKLCTAVIYSSL